MEEKILETQVNLEENNKENLENKPITQEELDKYCLKLQLEDKEIVLIRTAHVLPRSAEVVERMVKEFNPDCICVELDKIRYENIKNPNDWKNKNVIDIIKKKKVGLLIANIILSNYQRKMAKKLNSKVGAEMIKGIDLAEQNNIELVLADRDIQTTFLRVWRGTSFWQKIKMLFSIMGNDDEADEELSAEDIDAIMEKDALTEALAEVGQSFPRIKEILLDERDKYLSHSIKNAKGKKILAVLGAAHVDGVSRELYKDQNIQELEYVPKPKMFGKVLKWAIPLIILAIFVYGFVNGVQTGLNQVWTWFFWNALMAGIFTLLACGHPLSILTSVVAAPFTSLNPLVACGWISGLVEASVRKPTVSDVEELLSGDFKLNMFIKNRFLRAIFVLIMANIGSSIGTIIAGSNLIKNLFH